MTKKETPEPRHRHHEREIGITSGRRWVENGQGLFSRLSWPMPEMAPAHLVLGFAFPLPDVGGDDPLRLLP